MITETLGKSLRRIDREMKGRIEREYSVSSRLWERCLEARAVRVAATRHEGRTLIRTFRPRDVNRGGRARATPHRSLSHERFATSYSEVRIILRLACILFSFPLVQESGLQQGQRGIAVADPKGNRNSALLVPYVSSAADCGINMSSRGVSGGLSPSPAGWRQREPERQNSINVRA